MFLLFDSWISRLAFEGPPGSLAAISPWWAMRYHPGKAPGCNWLPLTLLVKLPAGCQQPEFFFGTCLFFLKRGAHKRGAGESLNEFASTLIFPSVCRSCKNKINTQRPFSPGREHNEYHHDKVDTAVKPRGACARRRDT